MKKLGQKTISLFLSLVMLFSISSTASAISFYSRTYSTDSISNEEISLANEAYASLTPEARDIFNAYLLYDDELLQFHKTYIDPNFNISSTPTTYSAIADPLITLGEQLSGIPLPTAVLYSFKAMGAGMVAAIADGPLPVGDILLAASTAAVVATVAICWNDVAPYWPQIVNAFKKAFTDSVDNIIDAFSVLQADSKEAAREESDKRIGKALEGKTRVSNTGSGTKQYEGEGGLEQAEEDFENMNEGDVTEYVSQDGKKVTRVGHLPDGTVINVRNYSTYTDNVPTLEIQRPGNGHIKIRYK